MIEIESERLLLRSWCNADFAGVAEMFCDEQTARYIGGVCTRDEAWRRMATIVGHWVLRGFGLWALEEKASGRFVGACGLWYPEGWPDREVGWWLLPAAQSQGYATEAARRARLYAYKTLGFNTLISIIHPDNTPSLRVAERLGARFERSLELRGIQAVVYRHPDARTILAQTVSADSGSS